MKLLVLISFLLLAFLGISCETPVVFVPRSQMPYRTRHFEIYYDSTTISPRTMERIGLEKESLLVHVNEYLKTDFDGVITVYVDDSRENSYAYPYDITRERTTYILTDDGHEMAHIISIRAWGHSRFNALVEGLAVAAEDYGDGNAVESYVKGRLRYDNKVRDLLYNDFAENEFDYSYTAYCRAGAFVHFVISRYGLESFKELYNRTVNTSNSFPLLYEHVFHESFSNDTSAFFSALKSYRMPTQTR